MLLKNFKYVDRLEFLVERNNYDVKRLKNVINIAERCYKTFVTNILVLGKTTSSILLFDTKFT